MEGIKIDCFPVTAALTNFLYMGHESAFEIHKWSHDLSDAEVSV